MYCYILKMHAKVVAIKFIKLCNGFLFFMINKTIYFLLLIDRMHVVQNLKLFKKKHTSSICVHNILPKEIIIF